MPYHCRDGAFELHLREVEQEPKRNPIRVKIATREENVEGDLRNYFHQQP